MQLTPTAEQKELRDAVAAFCAQEVNAERLAAWDRVPRGIDEGCWKSIAGLGWFGLALPEARGGSGLGLVELALVLQETARGLIPRSVIGAMRGGWALRRLDPAAPELAAVARGEQVVTIARDEADRREAENYRTRIEESGGRLRLHGEKAYVPNALHADLHIVAARAADGLALVLVGREQSEVRGLRTFDGEEQGMVRYAGAPVIRRLDRPGGAAEALRTLRDEETALALAEMVGGMQAALDMTVAYVKEREQFGQKIGVFQAVQHQVADMATSCTAARHLAWQAITRLAGGTRSELDLPVAAAFVGQAFKKITFAAHHLHGGAGFVVEHPLHYHSERAQALCIRYTPEAAALAAVAAEILD